MGERFKGKSKSGTPNRNLGRSPFFRPGILGPDQYDPRNYTEIGEGNWIYGPDWSKGYGPNEDLTKFQNDARIRQAEKLIRLREEGHPWALKPENQKYYSKEYLGKLYNPGDDSQIVNVEKIKEKVGQGIELGAQKVEGALPYNAEAQTNRNRQSQINQMLQQHGKVLLDPAGGAVAGFGLGMALGDGKLKNALIGGGLGYLLARSNTINLPKGKNSFDESQAIDGSQKINENEEVYKTKADISAIDPNNKEIGLAFTPGFTDANSNRENTFGQDSVTMLAQSFKTTGDDTFGSNMQPNIGGGLVAGLNLPAPGGQPGNVANPADELVTSFTKGKVPDYVFKTLGGSVV